MGPQPEVMRDIAAKCLTVWDKVVGAPSVLSLIHSAKAHIGTNRPLAYRALLALLCGKFSHAESLA